MRGALLMLMLILLSVASRGQQWAFEYWHDGKIVLETGDTLKGKIKYDLSQELLQFEKSGKHESYTSRKVVFYEIFDATSSRYRAFYAIPFAVAGGYKTPRFFELLSEGVLTLLSHEVLESVTTHSGSYYGSYTRTVLMNKFYVLNSKGQLEPFSGKKNDLLALMAKREDEIRKFMKVNRLDPDRKNDLARIFEHYNSIQKN